MDLYDLLQKYNLGEIKIYWEDAYAKQYKVETSANAKEWFYVNGKNTNGGNDVLPMQNKSARYVRIYCQERLLYMGMRMKSKYLVRFLMPEEKSALLTEYLMTKTEIL